MHCVLPTSSRLAPIGDIGPPFGTHTPMLYCSQLTCILLECVSLIDQQHNCERQANKDKRKMKRRERQPLPPLAEAFPPSAARMRRRESASQRAGVGTLNLSHRHVTTNVLPKLPGRGHILVGYARC